MLIIYFNNIMYHKYSNFRAENDLDSLLNEHNVLGICDIDTRYLTKM